ncbi:hypothetical protein CCACVL1_17625, partial [Corchorus capsularis]
KWSVPGPLAGMTEYYLGEVSKDADWRTPIIEQLRERKSSNLRFLKSYTMIQGALYYRGPNGILASRVLGRVAFITVTDITDAFVVMAVVYN